MPNREKIILLLAAGCVVYGLYIFLFAPSKKAPSVVSGEKVVQTQKLVSDVTEGLKKVQLSEVEGYIIKSAGDPWARDPFYHRAITEMGKVQEEEKEVLFTYSGFLELGTSKVAIINGRDYQVGESLEEEGYVLQKILPERVVIVKQKQKKSIIVPHRESIVTGETPSEGNR
ncbi:MAG: hypothetical protein ABIG67_05695 [Pseudomonadota bacterium]